MNPYTVARLVLVMSFTFFWTHAHAAGEKCTDIQDDKARLACYDTASGRVAPASGKQSAAATLAPATPGAAVVTGAPSATGAAAATGVAAFGLAPAPAAKDAAAFGLPPAPAPVAADLAKDGLTAVVTEVAPQAVPGRWTVSLDNGQVWAQNETTGPAQRPRAGDTVTIKHASLGSYLLIAPGRGSSRVRRVR